MSGACTCGTQPISVRRDSLMALEGRNGMPSLRRVRKIFEATCLSR